MLWNNKKMQHLSLNNCHITNYGVECMAEGMMKNVTLKHLELTNNKFNQNGIKKWSEVLGKTGLTYLDLSHNPLND